MHIEPRTSDGELGPPRGGMSDGQTPLAAESRSSANNVDYRDDGAAGNRLSSTVPLNTEPGRNWSRAVFLPLAILAWGALLVALFLLAGHVAQTLIYLAIAGLIAYALLPFVDRLSRWMPRWAAVTITYLVFVGLIVGLIYLIITTVAPQISALATQITHLAKTGQLQTDLNRYLGRFGISTGSLSGAAAGAAASLRGVATNLPGIVTGIFDAALGVIVIIVISLYFLADAPQLGRWLRRSTPIQHRERTSFFIETFNRVIGGYIRGQVTLAILIGVLVGVGLGVLQVPYAILLGVLAFVLEFIPFIGVFISGGASVLVALFAHGWLSALIVLAYFVIIHIFEGDVVGPRIVGSAVGVHPALQLVALIAGAELFGLWGALFAAPVAGIIQALLSAFWSEYRRAHLAQFPELAEANNGTHRTDPQHSPALTKTGVHEDIKDPVKRHKQDLDGERGIFFNRRRPRHS